MLHNCISRNLDRRADRISGRRDLVTVTAQPAANAIGRRGERPTRLRIGDCSTRVLCAGGEATGDHETRPMTGAPCHRGTDT